MTHKIEEELKTLCKEILHKNKSLEEWAEIESCDMFQSDKYCGGFESIEDQFCFSVYLPEGEYWFQFPLKDVERIISGEIKEISIRPAGTSF